MNNETVAIEINNLSQIEGLLTFDSEDDFYHLQIIKRKKEHPELGSNSMIVKTYYISSVEYLQKKMGEIIVLCRHHDARGCINLNRRSYEKVGFHMLMKVTGQIMAKDFYAIKSAYDSVCGTQSNEPVKRWIIDIDEHNTDLAYEVAAAINPIEPIGAKVVALLETKNGLHLITTPFNISKFRLLYPDIEIHKDNPTILYIPLNLNQNE